MKSKREIRNLEYQKNNYTEKRLYKYIYKVYNIKTGHISYRLGLWLNGKPYSKAFPTLSSAIKVRNAALKLRCRSN